MGKSIKNLSSITIVGLDIAKNVFQVHGVDAEGALVVAKAVRRGGHYGDGAFNLAWLGQESHQHKRL